MFCYYCGWNIFKMKLETLNFWEQFVCSIRKEVQRRSWAKIYNGIWEIPVTRSWIMTKRKITSLVIKLMCIFILKEILLDDHLLWIQSLTVKSIFLHSSRYPGVKTAARKTAAEKKKEKKQFYLIIREWNMLIRQIIIIIHNYSKT